MTRKENSGTRGYELNYLNMMAGPKREWKFQNDPIHEWIVEQ
ncbi:5-deoxy-glucuronate isomerase [Litchfieldella qijiaojingensis]